MKKINFFNPGDSLFEFAPSSRNMHKEYLEIMRVRQARRHFEIAFAF
jgi:hypothetical protein